MTLIKEIHDNQGTIVGYDDLPLGGRKTIEIELTSLFDWFKNAGAVDIYVDYWDDMTLLYVIRSYLRYKAIQTSTQIGKRPPADKCRG